MKPTIFVCGAYSTGKTTFIRNLLGKDFLDIHIGPEPTTDRFDILIYGREEIVVGGDVVVSLPHLPFSSLTALGLEFVNKMVATTVNSPILRKMNIIDSPVFYLGRSKRSIVDTVTRVLLDGSLKEAILYSLSSTLARQI